MKKNCHIITLAILFAGVFCSCENDLEKVKLVTSLEEKLPVETSTNIEVLYSDSAKIKVKLSAPYLERYVGDKNYVEFSKGVKMIFYNDKKEPDSEIKANYAINFEDDQRMEAMNDVVVINRKGEKLNTEHLIWDSKSGIIHTDEFVKITTKDEILYGDGLEANEDFTQYKILNIKGIIEVKDNFETEDQEKEEEDEKL